MPDPSNTTIFIQNCLDRMRAGESAALDPLIARAVPRLQRLARRLTRDYPRLRPYADFEDALQAATMRLIRALHTATPETAADFYRLATIQIRRELIDLTRKFFGPHGDGRNQVALMPTQPDGESSPEQVLPDPIDSADDLGKMTIWSEFHEAVEGLPTEDLVVFDLLWYHEFSQAEAAEVLHISVPTIKRRWKRAILQLMQKLKGEVPGLDS